MWLKQRRLTWLTWSRTLLIALSQRCRTNALRSTASLVTGPATSVLTGGGRLSPSRGWSVSTPGHAVLTGGRRSVRSPSRGWSVSTGAEAEVVGDSAVSALICRRALASIVETLDGLDVDGDLRTGHHPLQYSTQYSTVTVHTVHHPASRPVQSVVLHYYNKWYCVVWTYAASNR